ncbi:hypothetical protein LINPERPRIM_LOCUS25795 [Linum perenne]
MEVVVKRFGDEESTLLDRFERMSFEVQLNQAILARSLSEPGSGVGHGRTQLQHLLNLRKQRDSKQGWERQKGSRSRGSGLNRFLKKLLKPILGRKTAAVNKAASHHGDDSPAIGKGEMVGPKFCKDFSRSVKF